MKKIVLLTLTGVATMSTIGFASNNPPKTLEEHIAAGRPGGKSPQYLRVRYRTNPANGVDYDETENDQPEDNTRLRRANNSFYDASTSDR